MPDPAPRIIQKPVDILARLIERAVNALTDNPRQVLYEKTSAWAEGLNAEEINRLAAAAGLGGPVIEDARSPMPHVEEGHKQRTITIHHRRGDAEVDPVVWHWNTLAIFDPLTPAKLDRTVGHLRSWLATATAPVANGEQVAPSDMPASAEPKKSKRSTERGDGRTKLIAALTKHHKYAEGGCLNLEPIGNNELARQAEVSISTASAFFDNEFQGHDKYRAVCQDAPKLAASVKLLNQEFSPHDLYGAKPPGESDRNDE